MDEGPFVPLLPPERTPPPQALLDPQPGQGLPLPQTHPSPLPPQLLCFPRLINDEQSPLPIANSA
ncbi:UNVERIFIED_CONTAM: hypothetical protein Slati_3045000 [Sesamum latifolium]|uniref:Uncharacterized protein n=1 Tax=Sesamum latifolium TaxID=2727402 RepID=A0AAW2UYF8_9LAMI